MRPCVASSVAGFLLLSVVAADPPALVSTKQQLRDIMSDTDSTWLLHFDDGGPVAALPESEEDTREAAWFGKLAQVWPRDVQTGKVIWATQSKATVKFASVGMINSAAGEYDSEMGSLVENGGFRLLFRGSDMGSPVKSMRSRQEMLGAIQWMDRKLSEAKRSLKRDEL